MRASGARGLFHSALCAAACLAAGAPADTVVLAPERDNTIFATAQPASNGQGPSLFSGRTGDFSAPPGIVQRALLRFDVLGAVPPGATIESATLRLTLLQSSGIGGGPEVHTLHRVLAEWGEGTSVAAGGSGAPATDGDATWQHTYFPGELWEAPGGDYEFKPSASQTIGVVAPSAILFAGPEVTADVALWLGDCSSNFGWVLIGNEAETFTAKRFGSREGIASQQPSLTIEYTVPACPADCGSSDRIADLSDLESLVEQWGGPGSCDIDGCGVGITDLLRLLALWGPCE